MEGQDLGTSRMNRVIDDEFLGLPTESETTSTMSCGGCQAKRRPLSAMAESALTSSKGRQNFQRVSRLLIAGATTVGRETFDTIHPPATIGTILSDPIREATLRGARMTRPQWNKVYPSPGKCGKSTDWDLTLIHKMLRSICGLTPPPTGWDDLPPDSDVSREADLVRLKYYRNSIYGHVDERMEIKEEEFEKLWKDISEAIIRLAGHLSLAKKKEWENAIEGFLTAPMTSDDLLNVTELKDWYRQDVETREELIELKKELAVMKELIEQNNPRREWTVDPLVDTCLEYLHGGQLLEWFCKQCEECVCQTCMTLYHRTHSCVNMNNSAHIETEKKTLAESAEKMRKAIEENERARRIVTERNVAMKEMTTKLREEVESAAGALHQQICERKELLLKKIGIIEEMENEGDFSELSSIDSLIGHLKTSLNFTNELAIAGTEFQISTKSKLTIKSNDDLLATKVETDSSTIPSFQFFPNTSIPRTLDNYGFGGLWKVMAEVQDLKTVTVGLSSHFTIRTIAVYGTSRQTLYNPTFTVSVKIQSDYGDVQQTIHDNRNGTYKVSFIPRHPCNHNIFVIVDGHIIPDCTFNVNAKQCVFSGLGLREGTVGIKSQFILTFRGPSGQKLYDPANSLKVKIRSPQQPQIPYICDRKDGEYVISYFPVQPGDHQVCIALQNDNDKKIHEQILPDGSFAVAVRPRTFRPVTIFGKKGCNEGEFDCLWGVAANQRDHIIVADSGNHRLQVFTCKGEHVRTIGRKGTKAGEFDGPCAVASDNENNIIVLDCGNCRIQVFKETGEFLRSFGSKGIHKGQIEDPWGLSIDSSDNIIVTDWGSNRVQLFTKEGKWLQTFNSGDESRHCVSHGERYYVAAGFPESCIRVFDKDGTYVCKYGGRSSPPSTLVGPAGLAIDKAAHLVVCDYMNQRVQLLNRDGTSVGSFGVEGKGIGQFRGPFSVAVMGDGKLVVSDLANSTIQVFE